MLEQYRNLATALGHILQKKTLYREPPNGGFLLYELLICPCLAYFFASAGNPVLDIPAPCLPLARCLQLTSELALGCIPMKVVNDNA
jgi:hypothetical protein